MSSSSSQMKELEPRGSSPSPADWANGLLRTARTILSDEAIQRLGWIANDLRDLARAIVDLIVIVKGTVSTHGENSPSAFETLCKNLYESLNDVLAQLEKFGHENQTWIMTKQYLRSSAIREMIRSHRKRVEELRVNAILAGTVDTALLREYS